MEDREDDWEGELRSVHRSLFRVPTLGERRGYPCLSVDARTEPEVSRQREG